MVEHFEKMKHRICFEKIKILSKIDNFMNKLIREAIEIEKHTNNINKEDDYKISHS
jgi:hypothetical protein